MSEPKYKPGDQRACVHETLAGWSVWVRDITSIVIDATGAYYYDSDAETLSWAEGADLLTESQLDEDFPYSVEEAQSIAKRRNDEEANRKRYEVDRHAVLGRLWDTYARGGYQ